MQMFIGDGAKLVRDAFQLAKEKSPCIIFIDEIDAIGTKRFDRYDIFLVLFTLIIYIFPFLVLDKRLVYRTMLQETRLCLFHSQG